MAKSSRIERVTPAMAIEGGRVVVEGSALASGPDRLPRVTIGARPARVVRASPSAVAVIVSPGTPGGAQAVQIEGVADDSAFVEVGTPIATGVHQVDNPIFDREGRLYVTFSGSRGQQTPISIYRVTREGAREPFVTGVTNPTSMAHDRSGRLYVSSRFDGVVYRVDEAGNAEVFASDLGVACGLAVDADDRLYVGDRSGTVFQVDAAGVAKTLATLPPSVAAYHLAYAPDALLFVTAPTLGSRDDVYEITSEGQVRTFYSGFGRPQGVAVDARGALYVVEALAGRSGVYRFDRSSADAADRTPVLVVAGAGLIGLAFDPHGALVVCTSSTVYRVGTMPS